MGVGNYSSRAERLRIVCDRYLDLGQGLREGSGRVEIWPCPVCERPSFSARFEEGVAGCEEEGCEAPASMGLLELVAYLDGHLEPPDERGAAKRFGEILEEAVSAEREGLHRDLERQAREERRWRRASVRAKIRRQGSPEEKLFD